MIFGQKNSLRQTLILFGPLLIGSLFAMILSMPPIMIALVGALGVGMFLVAKISILKTGGLMSFGPSGMSKTHRKLYFSGYFFMGIFILAILVNHVLWT